MSEKTANTVVENSVPDKPLFLTMLFNLYVYSQPLEVWADRTSPLPRRQSLHVDPKEREEYEYKRKRKPRERGRRKRGRT